MRYRKMPVIIDAIQWTGDNYKEMKLFADESETKVDPIFKYHLDGFLTIKTLEGVVTASENDWIVKGIQGEFYPVKPDIFQLTYEKVKNDG